MAKKKLTPNQSYEALRDKWYKKLSDEGFVDIEKNETTLRDYTAGRKQSKNTALVNWEANAQYYQLAANFLHEYAFESSLDKSIWMYHSEGLANIAISKIIRRLYRTVPTGRGTVSRTILKLRKSMFSMYILPQVEYHE
jgi:hypothetical protein